MIHKNTFKLCLGILLSFMMLLPTLAQNTKSFKGVVVDETGEPIIGAAVKVVDTTIGTITDLKICNKCSCWQIGGNIIYRIYFAKNLRF